MHDLFPVCHFDTSPGYRETKEADSVGLAMHRASSLGFKVMDFVNQRDPFKIQFLEWRDVISPVDSVQGVPWSCVLVLFALLMVPVQPPIVVDDGLVDPALTKPPAVAQQK